jgi:hypothetical protein
VKRIWELLALLIIGALLLEAALNLIRPLIPYMLVVGLLMLGGGAYYTRKRMW